MPWDAIRCATESGKMEVEAVWAAQICDAMQTVATGQRVATRAKVQLERASPEARRLYTTQARERDMLRKSRDR